MKIGAFLGMNANIISNKCKFQVIFKTIFWNHDYGIPNERFHFPDNNGTKFFGHRTKIDRDQYVKDINFMEVFTVLGILFGTPGAHKVIRLLLINTL